jgi:NAD(P)-dependent dehydrogenase (short-subunit alcohol dehydrogenase family)
VVNVVGEHHRKGEIDFDDLMFEQKPYNAGTASNQAQLARVMFTYELARRLEGTRVTANCVHPGAVLTEAHKELPWYLRLLIHTLMRPGFVKFEKGAEPILYLATSSETEGVKGKYYKRLKQVDSSPESYNTEAAARLWEVSAQLTGTFQVDADQ